MTRENIQKDSGNNDLIKSYRKKMDPDGLRLSILNHLRYTRAKEEFLATEYDKYLSVSLAVRDRIVERWSKTQQVYYNNDVKRAYLLNFYLAEFCRAILLI